MGKIFFVTGKSATGKDTIYKRLLENKSLALKNIVSYTTRPIREGEQEGVEYHFVSEEFLKLLSERQKVIESRCYHTILGDWYYFTVNDGQFDDEAENYILIGTLEQYKKIREYFNNKDVIPIYIQVKDDQRLLRAIYREQKQEDPKYTEVCRRYLADEIDYSEKNLNESGIMKRYQNEDLNQCVSQIETDIKLALKLNCS